MPEKLIDLVLRWFDGLDLLIATIFLAGGWLVWQWKFANKRNRKRLERSFEFWGLVSGLAIIVILFPHLISRVNNTFAYDQTGVLILRIVGDRDNSLQRDLVSSLNAQLKKLHLANNIVIRASDEQLDDTQLGLPTAQETARALGARRNAQIVIWGNRTGERKFWPRLTVVNESVGSMFSGDVLDVQEIDNMKLPEELVSEPICLAVFIAGRSSFIKGQYAEALNYLNSASTFSRSESPEFALLEFSIASCRLKMARSSSNCKEVVGQAIDNLTSAARGFDRTNSPHAWARTEGNLGLAFHYKANLFNGNEKMRYLSQSALALQAALEVITPEPFPREWAITQNNLASVLCEQATQTHDVEAVRLLEKAASIFRSLLPTIQREEFSMAQATVQNNLGFSLHEEAMRSSNPNKTRLLEEAITADRAALELLDQQDVPLDRERVQSNLDNALKDLAAQTVTAN